MVYSIPYADGEEKDGGIVYVVPGPADVGNNFVAPIRSILGAVQDAFLGYSITSAGDVNEDGIADILVGSPRLRHEADPHYEGDDPGRILLFQGPIFNQMTEADASCTLLGEEISDFTGVKVAAGDFNGDGLTDVLAGSFALDPRGENSGKAWVVYGPLSGTQELAQADAHLLGEKTGDYAGQTVADAGDIDGDGLSDLLIGALFAAEEGERSGRGYLIAGGAPSGTLGLEEATAIFTSACAYDWTSDAMTAAGDLNNDSYGDLLVSASQQYEYMTGRFARASLFYGPLFGTILPETAGRIWVSPEYNDSMGHSLLTGSDLTGDGFIDLLVGAPYSDQAGTRSGTVYITSLE
jgi:hypothetical protein